jgi:dTDP-4-dehydrorhamnose 3,5-epimerase
MKFTKCEIEGLVIIEPTLYKDSRGYFFEAYNQAFLEEYGISSRFVQDNQSKSSYGVIRGLHYQQNPFAQAKLVRVLEGKILDVAVDIRRGSPTYGQHFAIELSAEQGKQLYIPEGFAHGFSVLSETAIMLYKCNAFYNKASEGGIRFDDRDLNIDWKIDPSAAIVSEKDEALPSFKNCVNHFRYQGTEMIK